MIIINEQIISPLLIDTLKNLEIPVLKEEPHEGASVELSALQAKAFFDMFDQHQKLLTNSESCLSLLELHKPESEQNRWSKLLKDKGKLRSLLSRMYPDYFYKVVSISELFDINVDDIPFPVVIKPTLGYSSVGVYKVKNAGEWEQALHKLNVDFILSKDLYNQNVINVNHVLIEEWIQGEEYAVDGYFDNKGNPVILNMFKRLFKDEYDTSDRIYFTSKQVITEIYEDILSFMLKLKELVPLKNYPVHFEVKKHRDRLVPIEINPLRFAGAGTTDLGFHAYGSNVYEHYFLGTSPDWDAILKEMDDAVYSFCCAEVPLDLSMSIVEKVNHNEFQKQINHILEYREIHAANDRTFAIVFFKSLDLQENDRLLHLDLNQFITVKEGKVLQEREI
ncbi:ATP-grasp domain-containing protein [Priestia abyssalis]|uniref:ATP-grasp domain-containing protein n=1 Tax=Priestia abyssalis TaxID=1221450 RepID=UPI0009956872|nr:ATP-grasp domain-containing protein [Priestia abyssalis]